mgnify:CR=1 FL=1
MPISQGRGVVSGQLADITLGRHGDQLASPLHGKYAEHALRGNLFYVSTVVSGLAIPINTTTAPVVMLWNPAGSDVDAVLGRYTASQVSGTTAGGQIGLMTVSTAELGAATATGALITAFNQSVVGTNLFAGRLNDGNKSKIKSSANGTNTITAGTWIKSLGLQYGAIITTSAVHTGSNFIYDFDGEFVLPPGTSVYMASSIASVALFQQTLSWYEVPAV